MRGFAIFVVLLAMPCWAKNDIQLAMASLGLRDITSVVARVEVAAEICGAKNVETWTRVPSDIHSWEHLIVAIDKRHTRCIAQDPKWGLLAPHGRLAGTSFSRDMLAEQRRDAGRQGAEVYCGEKSWKTVWDEVGASDSFRQLVPGQPKAAREWPGDFMTWMTWVQALGQKTDWTETPCTDFWPEGPR